MATSFSYSADIHGSLDDIVAAYSSESYWQQRVEAIGAPDDRVEAFHADESAGTVEVSVVHAIPEKDVPPAARKVVGSNLTVLRTSLYGPRTSDRLEGRAHAEAMGGLGVIDGSGHVAPSGDGVCTEEVSGTIRVSVPLIGGKLEKMVLDYLQRLFENEYRYLDEYVRRG